jgi:hypothetical protein
MGVFVLGSELLQTRAIFRVIDTLKGEKHPL